MQFAQHAQLSVAGSRGLDDVLGYLQRPPGGFENTLHRHTRLHTGEHQLARRGIGLQNAQIRNDPGRPFAWQSHPSTGVAAVEMSGRRDEIQPLHERFGAVPPHDEDLAGRGGDLRRSPRPGETHPGRRIRADSGRIQIREPIDLRRAEEAHIDTSRLEPVRKDLRHGDDGIRGLRQLAVADGQRQHVGLRADGARLVHEHEIGCVESSRQVGGGARPSDPYETHHPVAQRSGRNDGHHLIRCRRWRGHLVTPRRRRGGHETRRCRASHERTGRSIW